MFRRADACAAIFLLAVSFAASAGRIPLTTNWQLQSSARAGNNGASISTTGYQPQDWYQATVPTTVCAALVENGVYPDPYYGRNLDLIDRNQFTGSWWYRTQFTLPARQSGQRVWLDFLGISHKADIWLNGVRIADASQAFGCFRTFEFDITSACVTGTNVLAVEVFKADPALDLKIHYVDWAPVPPDQNMGLYREAFVTTSGPLKIRNPHVTTALDLPSRATARLTVVADISNATGSAVEATVSGTVGSVSFSQTVNLAANQTREVVFSPESYSQLNISNPQLWWPWQYGDQPLQRLSMQVSQNGTLSDSTSTRFGIRQITSHLSNEDFRVFEVNGKPIFIKGAGWCPDLLQRFTAGQQAAHIRYVRDLNLNTIRLEGKFEDQHFYDLCDEAGILVLAGWCCCDKWERWEQWRDEDYTAAYGSLSSKLTEMRSHACMLGWMNGSDFAPIPEVETEYLAIASRLRWPNPIISNATAAGTSVSGLSGVKMTGPYEWVPPNYWLTKTDRGGAFGFNSETGPGPAVPPLASLKKMLPADKLWPINADWNYHCGGNAFNSVDVFTAALNNRLGPAGSVEDYAIKAQVLAYESHRAMFEGYARNKYHATGVIQWMLNNAWPSMIWHLYDYYMRPGGSYYGVKNGCEPLHIQYSPDNQSIAVVNSYATAFSGLTAAADVYNLDATSKYHHQQSFNIDADAVKTLFTLPAIQGLSTSHFLRLTLTDANSRPVSVNSYWLSTVPDVLEDTASNWYVTPVRSYADLTGLQDLPQVNVALEATGTAGSDERQVSVTVRNTSEQIAFAVHLAVTRGAGGEEVLPIVWQDNYFMLLPEEKRTVTASFQSRDLGAATPTVVVDGWNVAPASSAATGVRSPRTDIAFAPASRYAVSVYSMLGRKVWERTVAASGSWQGAVRQLRSGPQRLPAGMYVLRVAALDRQSRPTMLVPHQLMHVLP
jgi:exo-1,4-beta-D-glucosaminidase